MGVNKKYRVKGTLFAKMTKCVPLTAYFRPKLRRNRACTSPSNVALVVLVQDSVGAMHLVVRGALVPAGAFFDCAPLRHGAVVGDGCQRAAISKCFLTDSCHSLANML